MSQASCEKTFSMEVGSACVDWDAMVWDVATTFIFDNAGPAVLTASAGNVHFRVASSGDILFSHADALLHGTVLYTGTGCTIRLVLEVLQYSPGALLFFQVRQDASILLSVSSLNYLSLPPGIVVGINTFDLPLVAGVNSVITVLGTRFVNQIGEAMRFGAPTAVMDVNMTFSNV